MRVKLNLTIPFSAWRMNRDFVNEHNEKDEGYSLELNHFADIHWPQWLRRKAYNQIMAENEYIT